MGCAKCYTTFPRRASRPQINFCPLHAAAENMLTTLNRFIIYHTQQVGQLTHILEAAEQITSKAEKE